MGKPTRQSEKRVWFCCETDADHGRVGFVVYFGFPVVDLVLLGDWKIGLHTALGVKELNFRAPFNETVCDF